MSAICLEELLAKFENVQELECRDVSDGKATLHVLYLFSLCDDKAIAEHILRPLMENWQGRQTPEYVMTEILQIPNVQEPEDMKDAIRRLLMGQALVFFPQQKRAIACFVRFCALRSVDIPQTETVIKGPREGFTEDLRQNLSAIRRRIQSPDLKTEEFCLGEQTHTRTVLLYMEGLAPEKLLNYVRKKISGLQTKFTIYPNHVENVLRCRHTPFDTTGYTEKPDVAVAKLAEGRIVIVTDGCPFVITAPLFFHENFHTTDDYTVNPFLANMGRTFRWASFIMSTFIPGLYLALVTYHFKLVPNIFLYRLVLFRAGVPVPTVIELLYMMLFFQIIREAGVRLPHPIGPTLSIVGALILGEAAVTSGLASQITVVIVAITSIASYLSPTLHAPAFIWAVAIVGMAALIGLPGFYMGFVLFVAHVAGLTSCGYPFLFPLGTAKTFRYKDLIFRGKLEDIDAAPLPKDENA